MDIFPKFIVEDGCLIIRKVTFHKEMVIDKSKVKGGGWFRYDKETNTFILYGESVDFGMADIEDIKKCIENNNVFSSQYKHRNISDNYNFSYDTGSEIIQLKVLNNQN